MKLGIKKEYFDAIEKGHKNFDWRDAHITFVCEETGKQLVKDIKDVKLIPWDDLPESIKFKEGLFDGSDILRFEFV